MLQEQSSNQGTGLVKRIPQHSCANAKQFFRSEFSESIRTTETGASRLSRLDQMVSTHGKAWDNLDMSTFWDRRLTVKRSISCDPAISGEKSLKESESQRGSYSEDNIHLKVRVL